jgi:uncharacterized protein (UPF0210 family)
MKIRSITYFCNPGWPVREETIRQAGEFLSLAKAAYMEAGFEVQTVRLATVPFTQLLGTEKIAEAPKLAEGISALVEPAGIAYVSLGPAQTDFMSSYEVIPEAIAAAEDVFFSGVMADAGIGISFPAVQACAQIITRCAVITPDGFANLRFAALARVKAGSPFFPAAYHDRDEPAFSLALEAADLAVEAFTNARTIADGQLELTAGIEKYAARLSAVSDSLSHQFSLAFRGIDFSLAPYPSESISIGAAMQRMGVSRTGLHGSLAAAAVLTEAVEHARFERTGFSGLMLPVLEDAVLAERAADGTLSVKDLLLYSCVCGTGLDTVPLPGETRADQLAALLLDLSALALRLDKPLTARLMPIPGKAAGDSTDFDFDYFANSRVMGLDSERLNPPFSSDRSFRLTPRHVL